MRRYWKLIAVCVAVVCFCLMVFYKHQYDRMLDAFQVLDTFGDPSAAGIGGAGTAGGSGDVQRVLAAAAGAAAADQQANSWQRVTDSQLFVFSAVMTAPGRVSVMAVLVGSDRPTDLVCWMWGDDEGGGAPQEASVAVEQVGVKSASFAGWLINCTSSKMGAAVYMVGVAGLDEARRGVRPTLIPVMEHTDSTDDHLSGVGVCLEPSGAGGVWAGSEPARLAEFTAFHSSVGVRRIWLYDPLPSPLLRRLLRRWAVSAGSMTSHLSVRRVSWQFPFSLRSSDDHQLARQLLLHDCVARAVGHVRHVLAVNVSQYVVPRSRSSIEQVYSEMSEQLFREHITAFSLTQEVFCTDSVDGPYARHSPYLLINTKTLQIPSLTSVNAVWIVRVPATQMALSWLSAGRQTVHGVRPVNPTLMAVHLYRTCGDDVMSSGVLETSAVRHRSRTASSNYYVIYRQMRDQMLVNGGVNGGVNNGVNGSEHLSGVRGRFSVKS